MSNETYNGWKNYETWCVNLWIDNDDGLNLYLAEIIQDESASLYDKSESLKEIVNDINPLLDGASMFTDLLNGALSMVDWREIIENHVDDYE